MLEVFREATRVSESFPAEDGERHTDRLRRGAHLSGLGDNFKRSILDSVPRVGT